MEPIKIIGEISIKETGSNTKYYYLGFSLDIKSQSEDYKPIKIDIPITQDDYFRLRKQMISTGGINLKVKGLVEIIFETNFDNN